MQKTKIKLLGIDYYLGLGFLNELINGTGKSINELSSLEDAVLLPQLIFYSRLYACKRLDLPIDFTQDDIFDYIDENGGLSGEFAVDFFTAYIVSMTKDVPVDTDKKKVTKAMR